MDKNPEAVVIGGGIVGASIAHYLALKGLKNTALLEKEALASGATGVATALVRMHYTNPWDSQLALRSWEVFDNWDELIGGSCGFNKTGFIFTVGHRETEKLQKNVDIMRDVSGINTRVLSAAELKEMLPLWNFDDIGAAAYEPDSGYADPYSATTSLAGRARELGVSILLGVRATAIRTEGGRVTGVETSTGFISTPTVVLAAGAWSTPLARTAGLELPVTGMLLSAGILERPAGLEESHLACIDASQGIYFRPDTGKLTIAGLSSVVDRRESPKDLDPDRFTTEPPLDWTVRTGTRMANRIPGMIDAGWQRAWSGVDGNTPDGHAILDRAPGVEGLYLAVGMSGTGFKTAPAIGMCMAELITEGAARTVDIGAFSLNRFSEGRLLVGQHEYNYYFTESAT